jgi:hypothetical protein
MPGAYQANGCRRSGFASQPSCALERRDASLMAPGSVGLGTLAGSGSSVSSRTFTARCGSEFRREQSRARIERSSRSHSGSGHAPSRLATAREAERRHTCSARIRRPAPDREELWSVPATRGLVSRTHDRQSGSGLTGNAGETRRMRCLPPGSEARTRRADREAWPQGRGSG